MLPEKINSFAYRTLWSGFMNQSLQIPTSHVSRKIIKETRAMDKKAQCRGSKSGHPDK